MPKGTQWQPNLIIVRDELLAVWCQNSRDVFNGCYVSKLSDPDGKWANQRLTWDGNPQPLMDGKRWRLFPTQNPIQLRSGRVLAPVTTMGPGAADAPTLPERFARVKNWLALEKRDSVLYTDDGQTWHVSPGAVQPTRTWAQWEPTVWELSDGTVMMFARNNDFRGRPEAGTRPAEMLLRSKSADRGVTWTPHEYVPLETVCSRMHVLPAGGDRFMMVHNDWPAEVFVRDRLNLALFFNRGCGINFVAGPGLTDHEPFVMYPMMWLRDNSVAISYSQGNTPRSIKVVHVSPLPDPKRYYLFPRSNLPPSPVPLRVGDAYRFQGGQRIATRAAVQPGEDGFSLGAWVKPEGGGVLLETRSSKPRGGIILALGGGEGGYLPFIHLGTKEGNITPALRLPRNEWSYLGLTADNRAGWAEFHVNGQVERVVFTAPAPFPLAGGTAHIGFKRPPASQLSGLCGELRSLALFPSCRFSAEQHNWLHNALAPSFSRPLRQPDTAPDAKPVLSLDPADSAAFERDFVLPEDAVGPAEVVTVEGCQCLRISGEASAGVDLDENLRERGDRVEFAFRFRLERGDSHILCTVGDAHQPARLIARSGAVFLHAGGQEARCGPLKPDGWTTVELTTCGDQTSASVDGQPPVSVRHTPQATWLYLGQGYRTAAIPAGHRFVIDVPSVRSRVVR